MAAVILAVMRGRGSSQRNEGEEDATEFLDVDLNGKISPHELAPHLDKVSVHAEILVERLTLEKNMIDFMVKMPGFLLCNICFMLALLELVPASTNSAIHKHIEDHFALSEVYELKDSHAIFEYMEKFEISNEKMNPTSSNYWCEHRHSSWGWDDHHMVPVLDCKSPRYAALSLSDDLWTHVNGVSSGASASSSSSSSRRLAAGSASSGSAAGKGEATHAPPPCVDNNAKLQIEEDDPNATCSSYASHVCNIDLGILLCPKTCGFCSPFVYDNIKRYDKPQVTMLPVVVYQKRFETKDCHGFAHTYEMQPYNPLLTLLPALDGKRNGRVLTCVDRSKKLKSSHAIMLDCPPDTPSTKCINGKVQITPTVDFHGETVYGKILIEPHRDIVAMELVEWIDVQTDVVSLSTLIYTEDVEIFTSLTVNFEFDLAGNVQPSINMISYKDLVGDSAVRFATYLIITCFFAFVSLCVLTLRFIRNPSECNWGLAAYDMFSRICLCVYPLILLVTWTKQELMSHEYDLLLHSFLDSEGIDEAHMQETLASYFEVKGHIYYEVQWLEKHCVASYIMAYIQFIQMILNFSAHPRMAMLTSTMRRAALNMVHFCCVFFFLFCMLGFMAYWLLGSRLHEFGTFSDALQTQTKMIVGDIFAADGSTLVGSLAIMYWAYVVTFLVVLFFTLLNFFLAIVVDAFVDVKASNEALKATNGFFWDLMLTIAAVWQSIVHRLPTNKVLLAYFKKACDEASESKTAMTLRSKLQESKTESEPVLIEGTQILADFGSSLTKISLSHLLCRVQTISHDRLLVYHDDLHGDAGRNQTKTSSWASQKVHNELEFDYYYDEQIKVSMV
eukprot:TRINITY_DN20198_c0_g2_i1.p1 TRINITY_DN20198_c0_g2~~TRINITY_DN20198_c0_g2_i1.p1  ORF type:complete len:863 (-),score=95.27 TRINITY_DN20198_c0_g2_i1:374-2905(-)